MQIQADNIPKQNSIIIIPAQMTYPNHIPQPAQMTHTGHILPQLAEMTYPDHILLQPAHMTYPDHILPQPAQMTHPDHTLPQPAQMTHPVYLYYQLSLIFQFFFLEKILFYWSTLHLINIKLTLQ